MRAEGTATVVGDNVHDDVLFRARDLAVLDPEDRFQNPRMPAGDERWR